MTKLICKKCISVSKNAPHRISRHTIGRREKVLNSIKINSIIFELLIHFLRF